MDVIFVHGLTGDLKQTWTASKTLETDGPFWPSWLANDLPHLNYFALGFPASLFASWAKKEMDLYERAKSTLEVLAAYGLGTRPLIFSCHSLGGLLVKQLLRTAIESDDRGLNKLAHNCAAVLAFPRLRARTRQT